MGRKYTGGLVQIAYFITTLTLIDRENTLVIMHFSSQYGCVVNFDATTVTSLAVTQIFLALLIFINFQFRRQRLGICC